MGQERLRYFKEDSGVYPRVGRRAGNDAEAKVALLWGDEVYVRSVEGATSIVSAQGSDIAVPTHHLMDDPILCWYQIDCGQGDAALLHLPDGRWIMVDAGPERPSAPKRAINFLKWKIFTDQSWRKGNPAFPDPFRLDAVVVSHPDEDHFGGFTGLNRLLDDGYLTIGTVFHSGLGRFGGSDAAVPRPGEPGFSQLGPVELGDGGEAAFLTQTISTFADVRRLAKATSKRPWHLVGDYATWLDGLATRNAEDEGAGAGAGRRRVEGLRRVDRSDGALPGFAGASAGDVHIEVIGPINEGTKAAPRLRVLDNVNAAALQQPSLTRNGHSVTLRIDLGRARLLLTGDLNFRSQVLLMAHVGDDELRSTVAKACHHGSEDVSSTFLAKVGARATIFSSGDNESHGHPRARALGLAVAMSEAHATKRKVRYLGTEEVHLEVPLIYSTELARSVELHEIDQIQYQGKALRGARISSKSKVLDDRGRPKGPTPPRLKGEWLLADSFVYGMINVRTDGERVLIAQRKEGRLGFQIERIEL